MRKLTTIKSTALQCSLLIIVQSLFAQSRLVTGTVTDQTGKGIPGVTVTIKGSAVSTQTDANGAYRINVSDNATLVFSSVGFGTMEMPVGSSSTVNVSLTASDVSLSEVVVIGYGTAKKKDLTGSVAIVSAKDFNQGPTSSPQQLIQGKVPGLEVTNASGMPGAATTIRIRGNSTVRSGNNPLYVVDGIPLDGRIARPGLSVAGIGTTPAVDPLYFFNSNDISTISILKDASASAIYGSRAANGVVLIETKKGTSGDVKIDVSSSVGYSDIAKKYEVLNADEYRAELKNRGLTTGDYGANVDPLASILQKGIVHNQYIALSSGTENAKYRAGFGYYDQEGIVKTSRLRKYTALINGQYKALPNKRLSLGFMVLASHNTENGAPVSNDAGASGNLISAALQWNPTLSLKRPNGTLWGADNPTGSTQPNPLSLLAYYHDVANVSNILSFVNAGYKFTDWLDYNFRVGLNYQSGERRTSFGDSIVFTEILGKGVAYVPTARLNTRIIQHTLNFNKSLTEKFSLNAILGYEYQAFKWKSTYAFATGFSTSNIVDYTNILQNAAAANTQIGSYEDPDAYLQSYFGRVIGNLNDKFILTATLRADGSSKFGTNNRYGYFPSFAAAWNIDNEEFIKGNNVVSQLKLRGGWGITGNQEFPSGASQTQYEYRQGAIAQANIANPDLKWEQTKQWNLGLDFGLFDNRLSGSFDYFDKNTSNLLFNFDAIQPAPATKFWINLPGNIVNRGFEFLLAGSLIRGRKLNWNLSVNGAFLKNEVQSYEGPTVLTGGLNAQGSTGARVQRLGSGHPLNAFYTRKFLGFDQAGFSKYEDDGNTFYFVGDPNPKFIGGLSTNLDYGKWSFGLNFNAATGHVIYNETLNGVLNLGNLGKWNIAKSLLGTNEALANPITSSSRFLEKADYVKLGNATLRYNVGNIGVIKNLSVSLVGQNLLYFTGFTGFSPEVNTDKQVDGVQSYGMEYIPYPTARTIQLGVNFSL